MSSSLIFLPIHLLVLALLIPLAFLFRKPILCLLTPKGIPGVPAYSDAVPIWGDLPRLSKHMKQSGSFSEFFDDVARDLGPIAQIRLSFFTT